MLVKPGSAESYAQREAGGKGFNLYLMTREGLPVPRWIVVGARYFREVRGAHGLDEAIAAALREASPVDQYEGAAKAIRQHVLRAPLPPRVEEAVKAALAELGDAPLAVRSSAVGEDGAQRSFAGQLSTFLYVRGEKTVVAALRECWASAYSARALSYRVQSGLGLDAKVEVAVVLQHMIGSEKSGVLFSCDPVTGDPSCVMVNAVYGIGEGLVSGALDADTFVVQKDTARVLRTEVVSKPTRLVQDVAAGGLVEVPVPRELREAPALDEPELRLLSSLAERVERFYRFPQDIEWGFEGGKLYLLQARPVTTTVRNADGTLHVWDNSNIVESYGGITLPLTFTFAHYVYGQVYAQFCEILMVPQSEIRNMDPFLKNMIGIFHGRVYYNLLNWYKLTSILPGFDLNRSFMETMMGTGQALAGEIADRIKPPGFNEELASKVRRVVSGAKFAYFHATAQSMVDDFLAHFQSVHGEFRKKDYSRMPADEIKKDWHDLERRLLREWKAPIVNDFLCMVHFGLLKKLSSDWLGHLGDSLQNDLLCGEGSLESAEPTRELIRMAAVVKGDPGLRALVDATEANDMLEALQQSPHREFRERVARYIDLYGHRCMSEMKLEQKDLHQDPSFLFVCLKNYLRSGQTDLAAYEEREKEIRAGAEEKVGRALRGPKARAYFWSVKHARRAVREPGRTRQLLPHSDLRGSSARCSSAWGTTSPPSRGHRRAGGRLRRSDPGSELLGAPDGVLPCQDLRGLIDVRKKEYARYEQTEPSSRFLTRGLVYWRNEHTPSDVAEATSCSAPDQMKGTGCCPGVIEGVVKVVLSPNDDMNLSGEILVTMRTDPGWIPLYPSVSGLLVERGGLLSHSAIVAREMGLPTVVGVKGLTKRLKTGMRVRFDGQSGLIEILETPALLESSRC